MDPSDSVCIEYLRPTTVPLGLVALSTVVQVSDIQLKLQITGGIICLVDTFSVSQTYTSSLDGKNPPSLTQIFKRGQQYVCKIIDRRPRKGYADAQDIIATLDPSAIQEDCIPKVILSIPQVPLQCSVQSIEDHGYQMDIGFKGLTGFLTFDEAEAYCSKHNDGKQFFVGQVIRCCLKDSIGADNDSRIVQLALKKEFMKKCEFTREKVSENILNDRCILPGSQSFLTVMNVLKDGLVVNFMNEFAGFVGINHLKDDWHAPKENYKISDQFKCSVLYYNNTTKTFALSIRGKSKVKRTLKHFINNYHIGQVIKKAQVAYLNGTKSVCFKVDNNYKAIANVRDALDGELDTMSKDELHLALDSAFPDSSTHKCRIKSINLSDLIIVLSLRQEFLDLPYVSVEELRPADFISATVKKYVKDGIVVTFGLNLRAIILNTDLHDYISAKSYKRYPVGKTIKCRVLKVDFTKQPPRVYITNKEQLMNPEMNIIDSYDKSWKGKSTHAIIYKIRPDGLIVELFNNIKGFIPRRFMSTVPIKNLGDLFKVGQVMPCVVYRTDPNRQSLLLGVIPYEKIINLKKVAKEAKKKNKEVKKLAKIDDKIGRTIQTALTNARKKIPDRKSVVPDMKLAKNSQEPKQKPPNTKRDIDSVDWDSDDSVIRINPDDSNISKSNERVERSAKRFKFLNTDLGINWSASYETSENPSSDKHNQIQSDEDDDDDTSSTSSKGSRHSSDNENNTSPLIKSRRQRSEEAKLREEKLREAEQNLLQPDRLPQTMLDYERLVLKNPNSADSWTKYSKFFLDNVETEKARIVCRRALRTISFRMEKEKLRVWLHLIKIEAKYGGIDKLREIVEEAAQTMDKLLVYRGAVRILTNCGELDEAERFYELLLRLSSRSVEIWVDYLTFNMEHRDPDKARALFDKAQKCLESIRSDLVTLRSRFGQLEFKYGDVERGKTIFANLLSNNPRRTDLCKVYEAMVRKYSLSV